MKFDVKDAMTIKLDPVLPEMYKIDPKVRRAPVRDLTLSKHEIELALRNALRYIPEELHEELALP